LFIPEDAGVEIPATAALVHENVVPEVVELGV
jgi:hypothetical protein